MNTRKKHQSLGNWIASASFKANFNTGGADGPVAAFGYMRVGDVLEFDAIRLWSASAGTMEREIVGNPVSSSWEPFEITAENDAVRVRRSTTWEDRHIQWWELRVEESTPEVVVWLEFTTMAPTAVTIEEGVVWWETIEGNRVAVKVVGGELLATAAGLDSERVRQQLAQGLQVSEFHADYDGMERRKGFVGIRLRNARTGQLILAAGREKAEVLQKLNQTQADPEGVVVEMKQQWSDFFTMVVPECPATDEKLRKLWNEAWYVLRGNQLDYGKAPLLKPCGSPSKFNYSHQWLWDSCFQAIVWSRSRTPNRAKDEIANLLENPQENGRMSHEVLYSKWMNWCDGLRGKSHFVTTSQPPVMALAVEKIYERAGDLDWVRRAWPTLNGYLNWWAIARDPNQNGLAGWSSGWESGLDDSPRWDHIPRDHNTFFPGVVEAVELNALLVNEWRTMARLGRLLGMENEARACEEKGRKILGLMRATLWDEQEGFFFCRDHEDKPIRMKTVAGLFGLLAVDKGDPEIKPLLAHLTNEKEFWTSFPVPSTALNEKAFEREQMWRGPTWLSTNWLLINALERLDEKAIAQELRNRTLAMTTVTGEPVLYEWYDPISGQGLGNMDLGWSTLVIEMMFDR